MAGKVTGADWIDFAMYPITKTNDLRGDGFKNEDLHKSPSPASQ